MNELTSPFPGMDPFLEASWRWRGVHTALIVSISHLIRDRLPSQFFVNIEGSDPVLYLDDDGFVRHEIQDVYVVTRQSMSRATDFGQEIAIPTMVELLFDEPVEERWLEIVERDERTLVTRIEILSPYNKVGAGYEMFMQKRKQMMEAEANWVEIDLVRGGKRPFVIHKTHESDYYALMKRAGQDQMSLWKMWLQKPLLTIGIPLTQGYADVPLNLQTAIDTVYREGRYRLKINYADPVPSPKLSAETQSWLQTVLNTIH